MKFYNLLNQSFKKDLKSMGATGPVKLIQRVNIARLFLQSVLNLFHFTILSLPM